ncbi:MAG: TolC family protein [Magnetococcales bacterium]|nr:TolC family protein [Magnetococcales bacterium]
MARHFSGEMSRMGALGGKAGGNRVAKGHRGAVGALLLVWVFGHGFPVHAEDCRVVTERMLDRHPRLNAAMRDMDVARAKAARVQGGWYPDLRTHGTMGRESRKPARGGTTTDLTVRTLTMSLNQLLWDFGKMNAEVAKAKLGLMQAEWQLHAQRGELLLDAATACVNLLRNHRLLALAEQSVANIRAQTGLEESRVEVGGGLLTDALQAKSQLAGAQARLARVKGGLNMAVNRYRALFAQDPAPSGQMYDLNNPAERLPPSLEKVLEETFGSNPQIQLAKVHLTLSQVEKKRVVGAELAPRIGAVVEKKYKDNTDGVEGSQQEVVARVEFNYPMNLGLAPLHALHEAQEGIAAMENRLQETRNQVEEQARNSWESLKTVLENADFLANQARIAVEFLSLAREERQQGARSLIDILSGETGLINAQSDALAARSDVTIAQFTLLKIMGVLEPDALQSGARYVTPAVVNVPRQESPTRTAPAAVAATAPLVDDEPRPSVARADDEAVEPEEEVTVIRDTRFRDQPTMRSRVLGVVRAGTVARVSERTRDGAWYDLADHGWVAKKMLSTKKRTTEQTVAPRTESFQSAHEQTVAPRTESFQSAHESFQSYEAILLNQSRLRAKPALRSRTCQILPAGRRVTVVGISEDKAWLLLDNKRWIAAELVKKAP